MAKELTQEELMEGVPVGMFSGEDDGELSLDELGNVYAGPNRMAMEEKALEHPELYRDEQLDALAETHIKNEEILAAQLEQGSIMRR